MLASCFQPFRPQDTDLCHFAFTESSTLKVFFLSKNNIVNCRLFSSFFPSMLMTWCQMHESKTASHSEHGKLQNVRVSANQVERNFLTPLADMSAITGLPGTVFHVLGIQYRYNMTTSLRLAPHLKHGPRILGPPACRFSLNTIECRIRQILQHESKVPGVVHNGRRTL